MVAARGPLWRSALRRVLSGSLRVSPPPSRRERRPHCCARSRSWGGVVEMKGCGLHGRVVRKCLVTGSSSPSAPNVIFHTPTAHSHHATHFHCPRARCHVCCIHPTSVHCVALSSRRSSLRPRRPLAMPVEAALFHQLAAVKAESAQWQQRAEAAQAQAASAAARLSVLEEQVVALRGQLSRAQYSVKQLQAQARDTAGSVEDMQLRHADTLRRVEAVRACRSRCVARRNASSPPVPRHAPTCTSTTLAHGVP